jgi:hypothetical protein
MSEHDPTGPFQQMRHYAGAWIFQRATLVCHWPLQQLLVAAQQVGQQSACFNEEGTDFDKVSIGHGIFLASTINEDIGDAQTWVRIASIIEAYPGMGFEHAVGHFVAYKTFGFTDAACKPPQHFSTNISRTAAAKGLALCNHAAYYLMCVDGFYMTYWQLQVRRSVYIDWRDPCADSPLVKTCLSRLYLWKGGPGIGLQPPRESCISYLPEGQQRSSCIRFFTQFFFPPFERSFLQGSENRAMGNSAPAAAEAWCLPLFIDVNSTDFRGCLRMCSFSHLVLPPGLTQTLLLP